MAEELLSKKEKEIKTLRKHPLALVKRIIRFFLILSLSITIFFVNNGFSTFSNYINIFALLLLIIALAYGFYSWFTWYYGAYILTNQRIIEVNQRGIFTREVREITLDKIQDVTYNVSGLLRTVLNVGTVRIHSASGLNIKMLEVAKPAIVREVIVKLAHQHSHKSTSKEALVALLKEALKK